MSILPIASATAFVPVALAAGRAATQAIGSFAEMLRDAVDGSANNSSSATSSEATSGTAGLPSGITSLLQDFASAFNQLLKNHNLDSESGVQLSLNDQGDVAVAGDHPQASLIQNLLAKMPQLSEQFRQLAAQATSHRKEQEFADFQANSRSPSENFPMLFSHAHAPKFQLLIQGESLQPSFE